MPLRAPTACAATDSPGGSAALSGHAIRETRPRLDPMANPGDSTSPAMPSAALACLTGLRRPNNHQDSTVRLCRVP